MNILGNMFGRSKGSAVAAAAVPKVSHIHQMNYSLSTIRWHMDSREFTNLVLLHDLYGSPAGFGQFQNALTALPNSQRSPAVPLQIFAPFLRYHGSSSTDDKLITAAAHEHGAWPFVEDTGKFLSNIVVPQFPTYLVGMGFGANVALLTALAHPELVTGVIVLGEPHFGSSAPAAAASAQAFFAKGDQETASVDAVTSTFKSPLERDMMLVSLARQEDAPEKRRWNLDTTRLSDKSVIDSFYALPPESELGGALYDKTTVVVNGKLPAELNSRFNGQKAISLPGAEFHQRAVRAEDGAGLVDAVLPVFDLMGEMADPAAAA